LAALQLKVEEDPEEFPSQRITEKASFQETDEFIEKWSAAEHHLEEAECARRLGLFIDLDDDSDAGPSNRHRERGDGSQGCSNLASPKQEPDDDDEQDYATAMYRHLGFGRGQF
jgi:hypothetical protein